MSESTELKPCPFCGHKPEVTRVHEHPNGEKYPAIIGCLRCNFCLTSDNEEGLFVRWNVRPVEDAMRAEVDRLNAYAMRLLSDETRTWQCKKCGEEFSSMYHGQHVIPAAEEPCPLCGDGIAVPKAWVMQDEIERLRKALEEIANHSWHPGLNYGVTIFDPHWYEGKYYDFKEIAREALEVMG